MPRHIAIGSGLGENKRDMHYRIGWRDDDVRLDNSVILDKTDLR